MVDIEILQLSLEVARKMSASFAKDGSLDNLNMNKEISTSLELQISSLKQCLKIKNTRVVGNGKVAVLISTDRRGWSTNGDGENALFCPDVVLWLMGMQVLPNVTKLMGENFSGSLQSVRIQWVDEGVEFIVQEFDDGLERVLFKEKVEWIKA